MCTPAGLDPIVSYTAECKFKFQALSSANLNIAKEDKYIILRSVASKSFLPNFQAYLPSLEAPPSMVCARSFFPFLGTITSSLHIASVSAQQVTSGLISLLSMKVFLPGQPVWGRD